MAPDELALTWIGETSAAAVIVLDQRGEELESAVQWTSRHPSVADTDATGRVTAVSNGTTVVVAEVNQLRDSIFVTVEQVPVSLSLDALDVTLTAIADTVTLTAVPFDAGGTPVADASLNWTSSDPSIASVESGLVTAVGAGTTSVAVRSGSATAEATVTVAPEASTVIVTPSTLAFVALGETAQVEATVTDRNGSPLEGTVEWTSTDPSVATVSPDGLVVALSNGGTTVTARSGSVSGSVAVVVSQVAATLTVAPKNATLSSANASVTLQATMTDRQGVPITQLSPTWSVAPGGVVSVDATGRVTPLADGVATVTASRDGLQDQATITVSLPPPPPAWEDLPPLPVGVFAPATATDGQKIYVFGGEGTGGRQTTTQIYDIASGTWSMGAALPEPVSWASAAHLPDGLHLVGGVTNSSAAIATHRIYDPHTDQWTLGAPLPAPVAGGTAQYISGRLIVAGGIDGPSHHSANVHVFTPGTGTWSAGAPVPGARINWTSEILGGLLYGAGGGTPPGISTGEELVAYNPTSDSWATLTPLIQKREAHGSGVSAGVFCVFGGRIAAGGNFNTPFSSTECYNPSSGAWSPSTPLPVARQAMGSVTVGGYMYAIGGQDHIRRGTTYFTRLKF